LLQSFFSSHPHHIQLIKHSVQCLTNNRSIVILLHSQTVQIHIYSGSHEAEYLNSKSAKNTLQHAKCNLIPVHLAKPQLLSGQVSWQNSHQGL